MKNRICRSACLLLALVLMLTSCDVWNRLLHGIGDSETELPWDNSLPVWSADETHAAAMALLDDPSGGIVDASKEKYSYSELCEDLEMLAGAYPARFA